MPIIAQTKTELVAERDALKQELSDFKKRVVEVAREATEEHGWCAEVNSILRDELGLDIPEKKIRFVFEVALGDDDELDPDDLDEARSFVSGEIEWHMNREKFVQALVSFEVFETEG